MAARFWVGGAGTWDASDTTHWAGASNGAGGQSVPVAADDVTFDGSSGGGIVLIGTSINVLSLTMGAFTGTLNFTNFPNVTLGTFSGTGAGTRTLIPGNGTWTLTGTGTVWTTATTTGLTFDGSKMTINPTDQSATGKTLTGGSLVFKSLFYQGVLASLTLTNMNFTDGATLISLPYTEIGITQKYLNNKAGTVGFSKQQALRYLAGAAAVDMTAQDAANIYAATGDHYRVQHALKYKIGGVAGANTDTSTQDAARRL